MSGLKVVDDTTFTVTLSAPFAQWPVTVGYSAFYPLPEVVLRRPGGGRQAAGRQRPFEADEPFEPGEGHHADPLRRLRRRRQGQGQLGRVPRLHRRRRPPTPTSRPATSTSCAAIPADASATAPTEFGDRYLEDRLVVVHLPRVPDLRQALRRQAGPPGDLDGHRPGGDRDGDLQRHPDAGDLGHRARRSTGPATTPARTATSTSRRPTSCSTRRTSTAASRSSCGSTPAPARTRGSRPSATSSGRTWASTSC